jgi:hypothetical protein
MDSDKLKSYIQTIITEKFILLENSVSVQQELIKSLNSAVDNLQSLSGMNKSKIPRH